MTCEEIRKNLNGFLDRGLDDGKTALVQEHVLSCPECREILENEKNWENLIRANFPRSATPQSLRENVLKKIGGTKEKKTLKFNFFSIKQFNVAFGVGCLAIGIMIILTFQSFPGSVFTASIADYKKFLEKNETLQIVTDDPEKIRSWFKDKLPFDFQTPDISKNGARLLGGKTCSILERPVAFLIYEKDGKKISAIAINSEDLHVPTAKIVETSDRVFHLSNQNDIQCILRSEKTGKIAWIFVSVLPEEVLLETVR